MPSIHSTELLLILVVALLVIGPERLPAAIRTASLWMGRFRRSFYKVKSEIERELNADEVRRQLHNESVLADIRETKAEVQKTASEARGSLDKIVNSKDFDPGASPATEEQRRNAAAERQAVAATGVDAESAAADAKPDAKTDAGPEMAASEVSGPNPSQSPGPAPAAATEAAK
ncbi:MAG: Sec-independent protein translocase protein TatB [Gammaproteobacteria bacterium]|nr:Sec-independent protein translocase protein TatB [Gammaproteobacteria bacterium]